MTLGRRWSRFFTVIIAACAAVAPTTGCSKVESYPQSLSYPVRSDYMVLTIPKAQPVRFNNPGHLPLDFLSGLPQRFDADKKARVIDYAKVDAMVKNGTLKLSDNDKAILEESKTNILDPRNLTRKEQSGIGVMLTWLFGTPAKPIVRVKGEGKVPDEVVAMLIGKEADEEAVKGLSNSYGVAPEVVETLKLSGDTLAEGSILYRRHCLHCHGLEGNGRGPTGYWVNPHPRDYRQGVFKFTSSNQDLGERKPRREDLMHVILHGIEGSSMPSFSMNDPKELDKIISYVIHLSMRGEVEFNVIQAWCNETSKGYTPPTAEEIEIARASMVAEGLKADAIAEAVKNLNEIKPQPDAEQDEALKGLGSKFVEALDGFAARWVAAQVRGIEPDKYPYGDDHQEFLKSAARGAVLFGTGTASCVSCHKNYGREAPYYFDTWGTIVRPRNLIEGYYRGGRRPIDMYYRVWSGINGAGMATYHKELRPDDLDRLRKEDRIWDLVNFMQALHYPEEHRALKQLLSTDAYLNDAKAELEMRSRFDSQLADAQSKYVTALAKVQTDFAADLGAKADQLKTDLAAVAEAINKHKEPVDKYKQLIEDRKKIEEELWAAGREQVGELKAKLDANSKDAKTTFDGLLKADNDPQKAAQTLERLAGDLVSAAGAKQGEVKKALEEPTRAYTEVWTKWKWEQRKAELATIAAGL